MALFSKKKKTTSTSKASASVAKSEVSSSVLNTVARPVLKGLRITEKAVLASDRNVYVFNVDTRATKHEVKQAVKKFYDVDPIAIRMVNQSGKTKRRGMKIGKTAKSRKAYVTLPAGQSIELA